MADDFPEPLEAADSIAPHTMGFKIDDGRATALYYFENVESADDLKRRILAVIGYNADGGAGSRGRILRSLPATYGLAPFLHASSINVKGYGRDVVRHQSPLAAPDDPGEFDDDDADDGEELQGLPRQIRAKPVASEYAVYSGEGGYEAQVEFLQRPYYVLSNDQIEVESLEYFDDDGDPRACEVAHEWERYCEIDEQFDPKIITATQGQLTFFTDNGSQPHWQSFAGTPRIPFAQSRLRVTWRQIPWRYVSSPRSYLKRFANRVNQLPFSIQDYRFGPGELLYVGFDPPKRYTPPFPFPDLNFDGAFVLEKWCDVTLNFLVARRSAPNPPVNLRAGVVVDGHNCLPWFGSQQVEGGRKFHFVASFDPRRRNDRKFWRPIFESFVVQLLWTDPDYPQPEGFV